tara:strand:+ start:231 stop:467 length:237 start_codon:yes stop_codon:yes gene_type:complete
MASKKIIKSKSRRLANCMAKAKGNGEKIRTCKINFAIQTGTEKQHGYKAKGSITPNMTNPRAGAVSYKKKMIGDPGNK